MSRTKPSFESDRQYLLAEHNLPPAAQSSSVSFISHATPELVASPRPSISDNIDIQIVPEEPATPTASVRRGFKSEEEYLTALRAWVEEKTYFRPDLGGLTGFYGVETMEMRAQRPGLRSKKKERAQTLPNIPEHVRKISVPQQESSEDGSDVRENRDKGSRRGSLKKWLSRC